MRAITAVLILLTAVLPVSAGVGVWTSLGPDGGEVRSLATDPSDPEVAYAGTSAGLYKTVDRGQSWNRLRGDNVHVLGLAGDTLYAHFFLDGGLVRSTDGGQTWTPVALPQDVFRVFGQPKAPNRVWATGRFVYLSENGGDTWRPLARPKGSAKELLSDLAFDPAGTWVYAAFTNGVYRSANLGKTWQRGGRFGGPAALVRHLAVDAGNPSILYAATDTAVFRSPNRGNKWERLGTPAFQGGIVDLLSAEGRVYFSVQGSGIFYSSNRGGAWSRGTGSPAFSGPLAAAPGVVYAGSDAIGGPGGPYRSLDRGATWELVGAGIRSRSVGEVAVDPTDSDVLYATTESGVLRSTDRGITWELVDIGSEGTGQAEAWARSILFDPPAVYAYGTLTRPLGGSSQRWTFWSDDMGETWQHFESLPRHFDGPSIHDIALDPRQPGALWGFGFGLFHSADRGEHWTQVGVSEFDGLFLDKLLTDPRDPRIIYLAGGTLTEPYAIEPRLFRSADGGVSWQRRDTGIEKLVIWDMAIDPAAPDTLYVGTDIALFRSTDAGQTWAPVPGIANEVTLVVTAPTTPTTLYANVYPVGILRSTDGGQTWTPMNHGLEKGTVYDLEIDPQNPKRLYTTILDRGIFTYEVPD